jgi:cyclic beta-1,2-glucan synthetase
VYDVGQRCSQERYRLKTFRSIFRSGLKGMKSRIGMDGIFREYGDDLPLRLDLFSTDQLQSHAEALAQWHVIDRHPGGDQLHARLKANELVLMDAYQVVSGEVAKSRPISPAGEWLLDNFYLIEEQIRTTRRHLPKQYSRGLPRLCNGPTAGYPRVYDIALELISHVDGRVDEESLHHFITAYQRQEQLGLGELWAIPIMMRQALIENLRRVAARIATDTIHRSKASRWAETFLGIVEQAPNELILSVADMARQQSSLSCAFVAEMSRRLSGQGPALAVPMTWIEQRLGEDGKSIEQMISTEGQQQAVDQVSISNSILGLRELDAIDWNEFVESLSVVEQELSKDPAGIYRQMDFGTRDHYRHVVEDIAKRSRLSEKSVAQLAIQLAQQQKNVKNNDERLSHVGYFLIDKGRAHLERISQSRISVPEHFGRWIRRFPLAFYIGSIVLIVASITACGMWTIAISGPLAWLLGGLLLIGTSHLSIGIVNWLVSLMTKPHRLPRLDFSKGIPSQFRCLVTIPSMLINQRNIAHLLEGLEVRYLANRDGSLRFCLLTDFRDAASEHLPEDETLMLAAQAGIQALNDKYRTDSEDIFFLFHRPRVWNSGEKTWMGHERKRGKLRDLNAFLRGSSRESFSLIVGQTSSLPTIRFVITLDTDTQLPRESAHQLVGTLAHPLNHARIDPRRNVVVEGYGILQPGVATTLEPMGQSIFAQLNSGMQGIDPYTQTVSDIYQDLFHEGSFIGKGIYDVDAFTATTSARFLDNRILSHDLIEGCFARSGLVNDIQVHESYPTCYGSDVMRRHRWMRGDWQIAAWILPIIRGKSTRFERNPLGMLSRWKILDNLRRSLMPFTLVALLVAGWLLLPFALTWTIAIVGIMLIPAVCVTLSCSLRKSSDVGWIAHLQTAGYGFGKGVFQTGFSLATLPYEAVVSLDAILRTCARMAWTHENMLEWRTASDAERDVQNSFLSAYRIMWIAPTLAILVAIFISVFRPESILAAAIVLLLWLLGPLIAWRLSWPARARQVTLTQHQLLFLHHVARKTWRFFDRFMGPEDHWLPPDNFQEEPVIRLAHRTSPTNIGISLLSTLAAYDFGYITAGRLVERTQKTFQTLGSLERFHGHFLNWYDTRTLQPHTPKYVSSVDSGNLAGHLLTLRAGLEELPTRPVVSKSLWYSLLYLRGILENLFEESKASAVPGFFDRIAVQTLLSSMPQDTQISDEATPTLQESYELLKNLQQSLAKYQLGPFDEQETESVTWLRDLEQQCQDFLQEVSLVFPWLNRLKHWTELLPLDSSGSGQHNSELKAFFEELRQITTLQQVAASERHLRVLDSIVALQEANEYVNLDERQSISRMCMLELRMQLKEASQVARERIATIQQLVIQCGEYAQADFDFLYNKSRRLLAIGYNVTDRRRDQSYYDLLASEARLASFVAIAQGQLEQTHWFALGRLLTTTRGRPALLSWSGSMFEYLMPLLVMPTYGNTLLDQTNQAIIYRQMEYGRQRGVPWGISESGYHLTDAYLNYQYRAFGVPGLGFKRGLVGDLVIAPYASAMALMVAPEHACANLQRLDTSGFTGKYGFYEAIDFTPIRVPRGKTCAVVRSYMAHHQGMSILALAYLLLDRPMQRRFQSDPQFRATELLLQERIPQAAPFYPHSAEANEDRLGSALPTTLMRVFKTPHTVAPEVHLLSNGRYHVMVTAAGGGYSSWKKIAVTRWREDATCDHSGMFCYVREVKSNQFWSTTYQPTRILPPVYEAIFSQSRAEYRRRDRDIAIHTEVAVSPEDDIEIRRSTITNHSSVTRVIELTSFAEVVLTEPATDAAHQAFSNLFVKTEIVPSRQAILCSRRPRSRQEQPPWMLHMMSVCGDATGEATYETDRSRFLGRCRTTAAPAVMQHSGKLSNSQGSVLDPIVAIRTELKILAGESVSVDYVTGMAETRDASLALVDKYRDRHLADRVFDMAWTHAQVVLRQLNASETDAQLFGRLASAIIFAQPGRRASPEIQCKNRQGQSGLWGHGISGDLPLVLVRIGSAENIQLARQLIQAHAYWRLKGLSVDLLIWNEGPNGYRQTLQDTLVNLVSAGTEALTLEHPGGIFIRRAEQLSDADRILQQTVARVILVDTQGTLADQLDRRVLSALKTPTLVPDPRPVDVALNGQPWRTDLMFSNGIGGFTADGREYVIRIEPDQTTPAPWVNVVANPNFGTVISESGSAYSWTENAHEMRLTPWCNDPVSDASGEAFYLRDDETGEFWSPSLLPARGHKPHVCRHGFGYSVFEYTQSGISSELWVYVAIDAPIKFAVLKVKNLSGRLRRLSATAYCEWVLGELRSKGLMHVRTEIDSQCGALLARNPFSIDFPDRVAFLDVSETNRTVTGDRREFLGRNGQLSQPQAMGRTRLSGKVGPGLDPCGAINTPFEIGDRREREMVFMLGAGHDLEDARRLVTEYRGVERARQVLNSVWDYWNHTLGTVHVETPDPAFDILANGWLLYQTLSCRFWARSGYYQSGGAYGFRDQLQDVAALLHTQPKLTREHLLRCASHQFAEGDVQHWWHPPIGRGVRTHFSDDYLWLPLITCRYVRLTGDTTILDESVPFLEGRPLEPQEEAHYDLPFTSNQSATHYDHCVRAIVHGLSFGDRGLPLMGCGDWNDGMNRVGHEGKGQSVWLAFFLFENLREFSALARSRNDHDFANRCDSEAAQLRANIEHAGWDGRWYRRAYFDNGQPLGSAENEECQIDSIAQSWSVLSGAGDTDKSRIALQSVDQRLVRRESKLIQLLDPPFDKSSPDPGYIMGYVPGVRENGGQYTHAAIWTIMAMAQTGDHSRAWELLKMINPIHHGSSASRIATYKVEPYVIAADVYAVAPHIGRGGWTWYTGSASWMYRLMLESLLGFQRQADQLRFNPCLPADWRSFKVHYRYQDTLYHITILQSEATHRVQRIAVDGVQQPNTTITLNNDRQDHQVVVELGHLGPENPAKAAS